MKHCLLAAALIVAAGAAHAEYRWMEPNDSAAKEAKQQRYEELLHAKFDSYLQQYDEAVAKAKDAAANGHDPAGFIENAREAARNCEEINKMWLESQKP